MPITHQPVCPSCGQDLKRIGYTEHGTLELESCGEWLKSDRGDDAKYYCTKVTIAISFCNLITTSRTHSISQQRWSFIVDMLTRYPDTIYNTIAWEIAGLCI